MIEQSFPTLSKTVFRLGWFVLMTLMLGGPLSHSAVARRQRQPLTTNQILSRIRRAHILPNVPQNVFNSFLFSGCMRINQRLVPKTTPNSDLNCITEETGVLQPSLAYVSVTIGTTRIIELVDIEQAKGWHIVDPTTFGGSNPSRTISALQKVKYDALVENAKHSLPALLALLQSSDQLSGKQVAVTLDANGIVIKWRTEESLNEFFFNPRTLLCEKQVRTVGTEKSIMKYSNYRQVASVMLPHTIVAVRGDGTPLATREIKKWELAVQWPHDHFDPETIRVFR